ncbi:MAG TPA: AsmA family protein [Methyloceanibacter sp.]|nr:AsmA family protein [Methyloceanibacter sp.]
MQLKHVLIGLAGLAVVVVGGAIIAVKSIDFNQYRSTIADQVKQATGRELKIAGDLKVGISLTPTVAVDDVSFANAAWGSRPEMATVKRFEAEMELLPLISGNIRVKRVVLKGADILLETDSKGQGNWAFGQPGAAAQPTTAPASGGTGKLPTVNRIAFEDVTITYKDGVTKKTQTVALQKVSAESADENSPIVLEIVANLNGNPVSASGSVGALSAIAANQPLPIDIKAEGGGATLAAKGTIDKPAAGKGVAIALTAGGKSLADLSPLAGAQLPPLGPYSFSGNLSDAESGYKVAGMQLKMGTSDLAGDASVALADAKSKIVATLVSNLLDAKDFGVKPAPSPDAAPTASKSSDGRVFPADPLPFDLLKVADASIAFNGQKVVRGPATLDGLAVALDLAGGKLTISKIDAGLSGGKLAISGVIDGSAPQPAIALKLTSRGVEAGTLLQTFGQSAVLSGGKVDLDVDVKGQGESVRQIMAGLNGHTDMKMGSAKINNSFAKIMFADLFKLISTGGSADGSNLSCVVSKFDIAKGVATSKALVVDTSGATIIGSGKIMLDSEKLDMHLNPQAKQASLASLAIPVNVGGTLASPSVLPDAAGAAKGAVVGAVSGGGAVAGALTGLVTGSGGGGGGAAASSGGCSATASMEAPATAAPAQQPAASKSQEGTEKTKGDVGKALKDLLP